MISPGEKKSRSLCEKSPCDLPRMISMKYPPNDLT
jgi:hypothetical protein